MTKLKWKIDLIEDRTMTTTNASNEDMDFMSRKDVAESLGVHIDTVSKYIKQDKLESIKVGRRVFIEKKALKEFIMNNKIQ
jgi:excisionase family DNA binding protein